MSNVALQGGAGGTGSVTLKSPNTNSDRVLDLPDMDGTLATTADLSAGFRNVIINGGFTINQRGYVSGAVLASGAYGHDRWKAGASGGGYSFTQLASNTTITIASGKSLIQVVEDKNVQATRYVVSWTGTAQARAGVNSAIPSGSYAASPVVISGQTVGTVMSIEFNTGTLGTVQIEAVASGTVTTPFESRPYGTELALCQRYYEKSFPQGAAPAQNYGVNGCSTFIARLTGAVAFGAVIPIKFVVPKRAVPTTVTTYNPSAANAQVRDSVAGGDCSSTANSETTDVGMLVSATGNASTAAASSILRIHWTVDSEL